MPKLYLLGGENVYKRNALVINEDAFKEAGERPTVVVFPWARASFDRAYPERKLLSDYFFSLGATSVDFMDFSDSRQRIAEKIAVSGLIYLTGGLVSALVERLRKSNVDSMLFDYRGVVVGRSAGALALCRRCVVTPRRSKKVRVIDGLGLADLTLKAHYRRIKDEILLKLSQNEKIYAIPSRSAIVYDGAIQKIIGKAYVFENGVREIL